WDAVFDPMGASTDATTVFAGTVWTRSNLLARQMAAAGSRFGVRGSGNAEASGVLSSNPDPRTPNLFEADWRAVAREVPAQGARVRRRMAELGEHHPFIRTEYCLQPLDDAGMLFDAGRQAQMRGTHARQHRAMPGGEARYALL